MSKNYDDTIRKSYDKITTKRSMKNKARHIPISQTIKTGIIFLSISLFLSSCLSSSFLPEDKITESLSRGKAVVAFGFSQGDQVIDAAQLSYEISKDTKGKPKSKEIGGFLKPVTWFSIHPGNIYDSWSLVEKHRSVNDAKIGSSDFYYPRYGFFEVEPGYYDFDIKTVYRGKIITKNVGTFNVNKSRITYVGTFYFIDILKHSKNLSKELVTQNFPTEENGVISRKKRSMYLALLDTYDHFAKLYNFDKQFLVKQIAVGDFYKDSKIQLEYPLK